ncbi:response regulator transcription factor [Flavobacterium sp. RNTU_13]|uniref:response regulator transcription factor n=1 Tax=Flavobacterium sp. RNTU_13 TaxID=3375145 RepID=UPI003986B4F7
MTQKILVVEDDARVSELLVRGLTEHGFEVTAVADGIEAISTFAAQRFNLVITDVILPGLSGLDICRQFRRINPEAPIIMLTALGNTDDKLDGFDAGADDYMVKPFELRELMARIRALLKRSGATTIPASNVLSYADLKVNVATKEVIRAGNAINLTPKEFKLLEYLLKHPEKVLSRAEIAENVWDTHFDTGTNFIDVYINYLRKKIDKDFAVKLIHTKPGMGFMLREEL